MTMNRRDFGKLTGAAALTLGLGANSGVVFGAARPKVVVIGGGAGGATAARYIAKDSRGKIEVTLIEPTKRYYTCFFSNLYIGGFRKFESIGHSYDKLASKFGVNVVHDWAISVDRAGKSITLGSGAKVPYDILIVSPGINIKYDSVPGYSVSGSGVFPHAWQSGTQAQFLKSRVTSMKQGGTFVMITPPNPYRCPPGPYERISMIAHHFKYHNPKAKIVILDPKEKFSKMALFMDGWKRHYGDMIEWNRLSNLDGLKRVDTETMTITTGLDSFKADAGCVIPAMTGGKIAKDAGLTNNNGWAPIKPGSMQSKIDSNIYVIGDTSVASSMPKSGFSANSQAKSCAMAVRGALLGSRTFPARYANTCWSFLAIDDGIKVGATYKAGKKKIIPTSKIISKVGESQELRQKTYAEFFGWYNAITKDMFGT